MSTVEAEPILAGHFDDLEQQHLASTLGMWAFLATEVMFFGGLFTAYTIYRALNFEAFVAASRHLNVILGAINTAVLLTSSLTMALAVRDAQLHRTGAVVRNLILTMVLGAAFLGIKAVEYSAEFREHLFPGPDFHWTGEDPAHAQLFFVIYFVMTGLHAFHLIIGIVLVGIIAFLVWSRRASDGGKTSVEITGLYWHFIDVVWVFLYPLLYLIDVQK